MFYLGLFPAALLDLAAAAVKSLAP
jgi:hypothetical protein